MVHMYLIHGNVDAFTFICVGQTLIVVFTHAKFVPACLKAFFEKNGVLPEKIIVYRDGVGDGQLDAVAEHELPQVRDALRAGIGQDYQ